MTHSKPTFPRDLLFVRVPDSRQGDNSKVTKARKIDSGWVGCLACDNILWRHVPALWSMNQMLVFQNVIFVVVSTVIGTLLCSMIYLYTALKSFLWHRRMFIIRSLPRASHNIHMVRYLRDNLINYCSDIKQDNVKTIKCSTSTISRVLSALILNNNLLKTSSPISRQKPIVNRLI